MKFPHSTRSSSAAVAPAIADPVQAALNFRTQGRLQEALDVLAHNDGLDLMLLDMWMPRLNGPQTVTQIRNDPRYKDLKIFAISGSLPGEFSLSQGPGGVDRWYHKPVDPADLVRGMRQDLQPTRTRP